MKERETVGISKKNGNGSPGADPTHPVHHERERILATRPIIPLLLSFSIPTILSMTVHALYGFVDRMWIGRMSDGGAAMAGVGLTLPLTTIAFAFMALVGIGSTALISIKLGQKKYEDAKMVLGNCLSFSMIVGAVIGVLFYIFADELVPLFGSSAESLPHALSYIRMLMIFNMANSVQFAMSSTMRGVGHPLWSVMTQIIGAVVNMIFDPIFILKEYTFRFFSVEWTMDFGLGLGVKGGAIATGIAQCVSLGIVILFFAGKISPVPLLFRALRPRWSVLRKAFAIGMSAFAMQSTASIVQAIMTRQLTSLGGDIAVAGMMMVTSVAMLALMPIIGIGHGVQPIIGYNYGAGNYRRVRRALFASVVFATIFTVAGAVVIQTRSVEIATLFDDPDVIELGAPAMRIVMMVLPLLGLQIMGGHYFQFIGRSVVSLILTLMRQAIILLPLYLILPRFFGLQGMFYATPVSDAITIAVTAVVLSFEMRRLSMLIRGQKAVGKAEGTAA
ncbi:MAG: MATE family efflux transporter [Clostridiaceae bacterium]|nr:MATE family efflux transporter [Clostridiaceae bacterium]